MIEFEKVEQVLLGSDENNAKELYTVGRNIIYLVISKAIDDLLFDKGFGKYVKLKKLYSTDNK